MDEKGYTMMELAIVVVLIGVVASIGFPRFRDGIEKTNRRAALAAVSGYLVTARTTAVARGCRSALHYTPEPDSRMWVTSCRVNGAGRDTLAGPERLETRWGVGLEGSADSISYGPRGVRTDFQRTTLVLHDAQHTHRDSVVVNQLGKVIYP